MQSKRVLVGVVIGGLLTLVACGDDGGGGSNEFSDALADSFRSDVENPFTDDQIDCLAIEFVADLGGPARFEEAGVTPDDIRASEDITQVGLEITTEDGRAFAESIGQCEISLVELFLSEAGPNVDDATRECIEDNIDEDALEQYFAVVFVDSEAGDPPDALIDPIAPCFPG